MWKLRLGAQPNAGDPGDGAAGLAFAEFMAAVETAFILVAERVG
jgi:hypothetical protein